MFQQAQRVCRFCLYEDSDCEGRPLIHMFQNFKCDSLRKKAEECLRIKLEPDDKIPPIICQRCLDKIHYFSEFLELTSNATKQMRLIYGVEERDSTPFAASREDESTSSCDSLGAQISRTDLDFSRSYHGGLRGSGETYSPVQRGKSTLGLSSERIMQPEGSDSHAKKGSSLELGQVGDSKLKTESCPICKKKVAGAGELRRHIATHWQDKKKKKDPTLEKQRVQCKVCKLTVLKGNLEKHLRKHSGSGQPKNPSSKILKSNPLQLSKKIVCKICKMAFRKETRLALHMIRKHDPKGGVNSNNKKGKLRKELKVSLAGLSKARNKFKCRICGEQFGASKLLNEHLTGHNVQSRKGCPKCNKQFLSKKRFEKHVKQCFYEATPDALRTSSLPAI